MTDDPDKYPRYRAAIEMLTVLDPLLAHAARTAFTIQGDPLGTVAESILALVASSYPADAVERYVRRAHQLQHLQQRFDAAPATARLGDPTVRVSRDDYDIALLLSIVFTNHRYELVSKLRAFAEFVRRPQGRIASIGMGTGYELVALARMLKRWTIEGYDTDPAAHDSARRALAHFKIATPVSLCHEFPLSIPRADLMGAYDALVLCEVLEHLEAPLAALRCVRACLSETGAAFVTMAVNIAQEDHVYWYPDIESCRRQIADAELVVTTEWIVPAIAHVSEHAREQPRALERGNYVAVVGRRP
ncbi:hypothetical protein BH11MYX1_BH11MYX1_23500 [soil metagenome]